MMAGSHLVVHLQRVSLSAGVEVLRVGVHRQVDLLVEALHVDRVPVLVVQETAHGDGHAAAAEPRPAVVCEKNKQRRQGKNNVSNFYFCCEAVNV